jgi:cytochrome c553
VEDEFDPVPLMGQHTRSILKELLKYEDQTIDRLFEEKVLGEQAPADLETMQSLIEEFKQTAQEQSAKNLESAKIS